MKLFVAIVAFVCLFLVSVQSASAQYYVPPVETGINWNAQCALEASQAFAACKANGGGTWRCLAMSGFQYWDCSGSSFESANRRRGVVRSMRARVVGARAVRRFR